MVNQDMEVLKLKILFVVTYFDCGGINRALQNLLNCVDTNRYDIDIFGLVPDGMFARLYKNCHILPRHLLLSALMARYSQQAGLMSLLCLVIKGLNRISKGYLGRRIKKSAAKKLMKRRYGTVVAFSEGAPTSFVRLMNHPNSVAWIHCDYANYRQQNNNVDERVLYSHFKRIVCVANYSRQTFLSIYPELSSRTDAIYNIQDDSLMKALSRIDVSEPFPSNSFNIVSVGRLDPVKRLSIVPIIAKRLIEAGCSIRWYVIGPKGGTQDEFRKLMNNISAEGVCDTVFYLGEKDNPYAYISRADLLVNTSISEACPYVINEAKILHTPIVCTNFGSAPEFIDNGVNGFVCSIEEIPNTMERYIKDKDLQRVIRASISTFTFNNDAILKQVYQVLD